MNPRRMRILLVANYEPDGQESMQRYAWWLEQAMTARGHSITVTRPLVLFSRLTKRPGLAKYLGYIDKFLLFPAKLKRLAKAHDLVHVLDHSNSMYLKVARPTPSLITCHDLLAVRAALGEFVESPTGWSGKILQRWILSGLRGAANMICVSQKTAVDIDRLTGNSAINIRMIHNPLNWDYRPSGPLPDALVARLGLKADQAYLFHVGGNSWYKNRMGVLRIFAELLKLDQGYDSGRFRDLKLVMAGAPWTQEMREFVRNANLQDRVIELLKPVNEELQALYSNAKALLFPSLEEGFGWPLLEAQACGCPVITSQREPMMEVAGEAAVFIDPANPAAAAAVIAREFERLASLRVAGFLNLQRFDQKRQADLYEEFYAEVAGKSESKRSGRSGQLLQ